MGFRDVFLSRYLVEQSAAKQISSRKELNNVFRVDAVVSRRWHPEKLRVYKGAIFFPSLPSPPIFLLYPLTSRLRSAKIHPFTFLRLLRYFFVRDLTFCSFSFSSFFKQWKFKERSTSCFVFN